MNFFIQRLIFTTLYSHEFQAHTLQNLKFSNNSVHAINFAAYMKYREPLSPESLIKIGNAVFEKILVSASYKGHDD